MTFGLVGWVAIIGDFSRYKLEMSDQTINQGMYCSPKFVFKMITSKFHTVITKPYHQTAMPVLHFHFHIRSNLGDCPCLCPYQSTYVTLQLRNTVMNITSVSQKRELNSTHTVSEVLIISCFCQEKFFIYCSYVSSRTSNARRCCWISCASLGIQIFSFHAAGGVVRHGCLYVVAAATAWTWRRWEKHSSNVLCYVPIILITTNYWSLFPSGKFVYKQLTQSV